MGGVKSKWSDSVEPKSVEDQKVAGECWLAFGILGFIVGLIGSNCCFFKRVPTKATISGLTFATVFDAVAVFVAFVPFGDNGCAEDLDIGPSLILAIVAAFFLLCSIGVLCLLFTEIGEWEADWTPSDSFSDSFESEESRRRRPRRQKRGGRRTRSDSYSIEMEERRGRERRHSRYAR